MTERSDWCQDHTASRSIHTRFRSTSLHRNRLYSLRGKKESTRCPCCAINFHAMTSDKACQPSLPGAHCHRLHGGSTHIHRSCTFIMAKDLTCMGLALNKSDAEEHQMMQAGQSLHKTNMRGRADVILPCSSSRDCVLQYVSLCCCETCSRRHGRPHNHYSLATRSHLCFAYDIHLMVAVICVPCQMWH